MLSILSHGTGHAQYTLSWDWACSVYYLMGLGMLSISLSLQANNGESQGENAEGVAGRQDEGGRARHRARGFPRIIKAGHGIKLGAVVRG